MPHQAAQPDADSPRPVSLREARRLFAELNNPIQVESAELPAENPLDSAVKLANPLEREPKRQGFPRVPGYHIERLLGEGGGGAVYLACRETSDKPLALKVLNARPGEQFAQRAWRELDLLSQVHLPAVPRVLDYGRVEGGPFAGRLYIATEYIDGQPIDHHCSGGGSSGPGVPPVGEGNPLESSPSLPSSPAHLFTSSSTHLRAAAALLAKTADALHALHERGVIHRDIKPANILIDSHGDPVIIDLGIATLVAHDVMETLTRDGAPIGSPAYMAPEQARGDRAQISIRSDVYALGATACLILTGHTPHDLNTTIHEAIRRVGSETPRNPRTLNPHLPKPLAAILTKALAPDPQHRYDSAAAFADDLRRWVAGEPVEAGHQSRWRGATRWIAKHPVATTALACATIALTTLAATNIAIEFYNNQPHRIVPNRIVPKGPGEELQLLSRAGKVLHIWPNVAPDGLGTVLDRPPHLGGGRVAVVYARETLMSEADYQLCIYELDDLETPFRKTTPHIKVPVQTPRWQNEETGGNVFDVTSAVAADVFPQRRGTELLVTHVGMWFPTCIRVYDLNLNVLYEAWHDGSAGPALWIPGSRDSPGTIILRGCNNAEGEWPDRVAAWEAAHPGQTFNWQSIGSDGPRSSHWPYALFAIQPVLGDICGPVHGVHKDPQTKLLWYKFIHPAHYNEYQDRVLPARNPDQRTTHFTLQVTNPTDPGRGFTYQVEAATGRFAEEAVAADAAWKDHRAWIERFRLVKDPLTPSYGPTAAPAEPERQPD